MLNDFSNANLMNGTQGQVKAQLDDGINIDDVQVGLQLTKLKPIHAGRLVEFYNHMTTSKWKEIIDNGWKVAGISDALELGSSKMPSIDPFHDIDPMLSDDIERPGDCHFWQFAMSQWKNLNYYAEEKFQTVTLNGRRQKVKL